MINDISIKRFKSVRELNLRPRRINIFIGEPNTGKSNILEALGMLSYVHYSRFEGDLKSFIRFETTDELFYDRNLEHALEISCDGISVKIRFQGGGFTGECMEAGVQFASLDGGHDRLGVSAFFGTYADKLAKIKFYRYRELPQFTARQSDFLMPPWGANLVSLLIANRELRSAAGQPYVSVGLRLGLRPHDQRIEIIKESENIIVSYSYSLASETLRRATFHIAAILSNKDSVLALEEPEAHSFPFYTAQLAELMALDTRGNQYFVTTHNPYFLLPILAKAPKDDVSVYITYFQDYETKVRELSAEEKAELAEIDVFSNLERYLERR